MTLALGTPVIYTQCAAVARKGNANMSMRGWHLPQKGNGIIPSHPVFNVEHEDDFGLGPTAVSFVREEGKPLLESEIEKYNKAVVAWGQAGSGVVCGLETKLYGVSEEGRGGGPDYDWEPGFFTKHGAVKLYVVRYRLEGREFVYVPPWAVLPVVHATT